MKRPPIETTLHELLRLAKLGGATDAWMRTTSKALVALLLEREDLHRAADPRRLKSMIQARRVDEANQSMIAAGISAGRRIAALTSRYRLSKSRIHALIQLSSTSQDGSVVASSDEPTEPLE